MNYVAEDPNWHLSYFCTVSYTARCERHTVLIKNDRCAKEDGILGRTYAFSRDFLCLWIELWLIRCEESYISDSESS